jgi:hypothetical protein
MAPVMAFKGFFLCGTWTNSSVAAKFHVKKFRSKTAYSSGRFTSKDRPKIPLRRTSGCGGGAASACGGSGSGAAAGKFSHFIEYTNLPSAVRPIGAQWSTRAVALLGASFVCAHAGEEIRRIARMSFFIGFSRAKRSLVQRALVDLY